MTLFDNFLKLRQRVNYETEAIPTVKLMSGFDVESLSITQRGELADSVLNQMKLIGEEKLTANDFTILYIIHAIAHVNLSVDATHLAQGAKNFMIENKDHINREIYDISIQKVIQFLLMFKENLITHLGSDEGIKIYDQWYVGAGFPELLKPYYQKITNNSLGHKS